jgi:protein SCO1/2
MKFCLYCGVFLLSVSCAPKTTPLATFNTVGPFVLTSQTGDRFDSATTLRDKVWVADFIFTTCTGPCPRMSSHMKRVQESLKDLPDVMFVSFTVDPENDTPTALAEYAKRYSAAPGRWYFLTGGKDTLHKLKREAFMLGSVDGSLEHSTRFILIDKLGRVRKYYDTDEGNIVPELRADVVSLLREQGS